MLNDGLLPAVVNDCWAFDRSRRARSSGSPPEAGWTVSRCGLRQASGGAPGSRFSVGDGVAGHGRRVLICRVRDAWRATVGAFSVLRFATPRRRTSDFGFTRHSARAVSRTETKVLRKETSCCVQNHATRKAQLCTPAACVRQVFQAQPLGLTPAPHPRYNPVPRPLSKNTPVWDAAVTDCHLDLFEEVLFVDVGSREVVSDGFRHPVLDLLGLFDEFFGVPNPFLL